MPYQNDMATLAQVVSPAYAAMQAGIQNDAANEQQQLANQKSQAQLPYAGPEAAATLAQTQANTGLTQAQTQGMGLKNLFTGATMPGEIGAANAKNTASITADNAKNVSTIGQTMGQLAGYLDNVPEAARPAMARQMVEQYGIDWNKVPPALQSGDPNLWRSASQAMVQQSAPYLTEQMKEGAAYTRATDVANIQGNARVAGAEASANARIQAAQIAKQMHEQQQTFEQAAVRLQATNPQLAQQYAQAALQLRQAQAGITNSLVNGTQLTMPDITQGGTGTPAPQGGGGGAPQQAALEAEMRRRGLIK